MDVPRVLARKAGHLASFVRLSLDAPAKMRYLQRAAGKLRDPPGFEALLAEILNGALALTGADFGIVQLPDPASGVLTTAAQSDFGPEFLVLDDGQSTGKRAACDWAQTVIPDIRTDPGFAPYRQAAGAAGFRAVISTPMADPAGRLAGVVAVYSRHPDLPAQHDLEILQLYADIAGEAIARHPGPVGDDPAPMATRPELPRPRESPEEFADRAVQRLFIAGLSLDNAQSIAGRGLVSDQIEHAAYVLDEVIRDIRSSLFVPGQEDGDGRFS